MTISLDYNHFKDKIGTRYDIVLGELQEAPLGLFEVTETYKLYAIYLNKVSRVVSLIAPEKSYLGRQYKVRKTDCINLVAEYTDDIHNTNYNQVYTNSSNRDFFKYYRGGMNNWFIDNNFLEVTGDPEKHDCLIYAYSPNVISHLAVYIGDNKILHHLPYKLSSTDTLEKDKILGVYRYAN